MGNDKLYASWRTIPEKNEAIAVYGDCENAEDSRVRENVMRDAGSMLEGWSWRLRISRPETKGPTGTS